MVVTGQNDVRMNIVGQQDQIVAAGNLQKMGYTNVISMDGGWRHWTEAGYPTEA